MKTHQHTTSIPMRTVQLLTNPVNRVIVAHIKASGPCTNADLDAHVKKHLGRSAMRQVYNLTFNDVLINLTTKNGAKGVYALGPRADLFDLPLSGMLDTYTPFKAQPKPEPEPEREVAACSDDHEEGEGTLLPKWVPQRVPPRQYDVMRAPSWRTPPDTSALRPGANDAQRIASFGQRC
jgi:hypothetical protein